MTHSRPTRLSLPSLLFAVSVAAQLVRSYKFSIAAEPAQCSNFTVHWDGGQAPYELLLVPVGHVTPEIRTIVDQRVESGSSTSLTLKFPEGSQFVASLSDASGVGAGGTSDVLTVKGGPSDCLTSPVQASWVLYMDNPTPDQCTPTRISWDEKASGPISMWGIVPGGDTFDMGAPSTGSGWDWTPNLKEGTRMMIVAGDSRGRGTGGSTDLFSVGGGSGGCINDNSPSTTEGPAAGQVAAVTATNDNSSGGSSPTSSSGSNSGSGSHSGHDDGKGNNEADNTTDGNDDHTSNATPQTGNASSSSSPSSATIVGIVLGTLAAVVLAILGLFFCMRSRRRRQQAGNNGFTDMRGRGDLLSSGAPSIAESGGVNSVITRAPHENVPRAYETTPFVIRPRGGAFDPAIVGDAPLVRSHSGYSADISDGTSTHGGHAAGPRLDDFSDVQLLAPSPLATPSGEKHAYLNPFSDRAAVAPVPLLRTPTDSPPSFKTRATGGHSPDHERDADTERTSPVHRYPSMRRTAPRTLVPHAELSTVTLNDPEVPPSYDSWRKRSPHNGFEPDPQSRFVYFGDSEKASSSGHS